MFITILGSFPTNSNGPKLIKPRKKEEKKKKPKPYKNCSLTFEFIDKKRIVVNGLLNKLSRASIERVLSENILLIHEFIAFSTLVQFQNWL